MIGDELKPGVRENDIVARANKMLYEMGSDDVEAINAISGERCSPHPHNFTDRMVRPGDQAFFDIIQSAIWAIAPATTGRSTSAAPARCRTTPTSRPRMDRRLDRAWSAPGVSTDEIAAVWPKAEEFGFAGEMEAFGLQFGHGLGVALHERPIISRLVSMDDPKEIKEGMVFALETYCPAKDGYSAARIEEEVVVTDEWLPAEELPITPLPGPGSDPTGAAGSPPDNPRTRIILNLTGRADLLATEETGMTKPAKPISPTTTSGRRRGCHQSAVPLAARDPPCRSSAPHDLFLQNLVKGTVHLSLGQEAVAAGFGVAMRRGRLHLLHLSRPRPHAGARRLDDRRPRRADGPRMRAHGRQGRLDASDQRRARRDGLLRHHRRASADRHGRGVVGAVSRHEPGLGLLLRRRHHQYRRLPRGAQHGADLEAPGRSSSARTTSTWNTRRSAT